MDEDPDTLTVVRALLTQFCRYPERADTAEGIARWWLLEQVPSPMLLQALQWLKDKQLIEARISVDAHVRYRRSASTTQLAACLQALGGEPTP